MKNPVIYADLTFLANFIIDMALLWITSRWAKIKLHYAGWLLAGLLGGVYGTAVVIPGIGLLYSFPVKIGISVLMVWIALRPALKEEWKRTLLLFYLVSFAAAGFMMALPYLSTYLLPVLHLYWLWLLGAWAAILLAALGIEKLLFRRLLPDLLRYRVTLTFAGKACQGTGFLDTGNGLQDPLTCRPVIVAEYGLLKECLPPDLCDAFMRCEEEELLAAVCSSSWAFRMRLIPYRSVGQKQGIMVGLRADEVVVRMGARDIKHHDLVVGVFQDRLSNDDSYRMLIPPPLINQHSAGF